MIKLRPWKGTKNEFEADIIVNGPNGRSLRKRVKVPVSGKSSAERWARTIEQELFMQLIAPEPEPEQPPAPTFEAFVVMFLELCRANRLSENTLVNYEMHLRRHVTPVIGRRRLDAIKPADIVAIKAGLSRMGRNTACEILRTLRRVFSAAVEQGVITQAPVRFEIPARLKKAPVAYDEAEQQALLAAAQALGPEYMAMLLLGMDAGLRRGEILGLKWSDLDFKRGTMTIRHNIVRGKLDLPKGRTEDEVGMTQRLMAALVAARHARGPFVFTNERGGHYKEHAVERWMAKLVEISKVPWRATHVLRKTCGTRIADGGGGVAAVAAHLRHKDLQTASRYIDRHGASSRALRALES